MGPPQGTPPKKKGRWRPTPGKRQAEINLALGVESPEPEVRVAGIWGRRAGSASGGWVGVLGWKPGFSPAWSGTEPHTCQRRERHPRPALIY